MKKAVALVTAAATLLSATSAFSLELPFRKDRAAASAAPAPPDAPWVPQIDTRGVKSSAYERDYADCMAFAESDPSTNAKAAGRKTATKYGLLTAGAIGVATVATGGLILLPAMAGTAATTGGAMAFFGGANAKSLATQRYRQIVAACLTGRGYTVLN